MRVWSNTPSCATSPVAALSAYLTINQLVAELVSTVACGGNLLLNVGCVAGARVRV